MRYWRVAPGENGFLWEEQRNAKCIALGWNDVGSLDKHTPEQIEKIFLKHYQGHPRQLLKFYQDVSIGDKIIASATKQKKGYIYGIGTISGDYKYNKRLTYYHSKPVKWEIIFREPLAVDKLILPKKIKNVLASCPPRTISSLSMDSWNKICSALEEYNPKIKYMKYDSKQDAQIQKWLFVENPKHWEWEELRNKAKEFWGSHSEKGRAHRVNKGKSLWQIEDRTIIIGYAAAPKKCACAIAVVSQKPHEEDGELLIPIRKAFDDYILKTPVSLAELKEKLPNSVFTASGGKIRCTYAKLTNDEYNKIMALVLEKNPYLAKHIKELDISKTTLAKLRRTAEKNQTQEKLKYLEGYKKEATILAKVRNRRVVEEKKANSNYSCEVCNLNFKEKYGDIGDGYIVAHHLRPIALGKRETTLKDLALVCDNCHRMLHKKYPEPYAPAELKKIIKAA